MKGTESKKKTIEALSVMIQQSDKGPSGFWVEDYKGCGNPEIFPEFKEGLEHGRLVQKEHYLCPWNTAVLYGENHGNITTGCYYSCSIEKAKCLSSEMLKKVLVRFKTRLQNGEYDYIEHLSPLFAQEEIDYIEEQICKRREEQKRKQEEACNVRLQKAAFLIEKYPDKKAIFGLNYGEKVTASIYEGWIDFDPEGYKDIVGAEKFTYDEYIDVQIQSFHKTRTWLECCYHNTPLGFKGCIEKKTKDNVCFQRIMVEGMYSDGSCFCGKENHVWMNISGFEEYNDGDCVAFFAEIYRYVKTSNGKQIDFSLRNPENIKQITSYELPSDEDLIKQEMNQIICETCYLGEQCNKTWCLLQKKTDK